MSQENVEFVRRAYEGVNADLEVPTELFDPDYEIDDTDMAPAIGVVKGSDAALEALRDYWETFEVWTFRDGKAVGTSFHTDKDRALEAVGLRE